MTEISNIVVCFSFSSTLITVCISYDVRVQNCTNFGSLDVSETTPLCTDEGSNSILINLISLRIQV